MRPRFPRQSEAIRLVHRHLPDLRIRSVRRHEMGWDCRVFEVNGEWMFRFPRREEVRRWMERSLTYYPLLHRVVPVPIPDVTVVARSPSGRLLFMGYRKLPGRPLPEHVLHGPAPLLWAEQLSRVFRALGAVPIQDAVKVGIPHPNLRERRAIWERRFTRVLRTLRPYLEPAEYRRERSLFESSLDDPSFFPRKVVLCHYDVFPHHVLVGPGSAGITGIIDWEDTSIADPAGEISALPTAGGFARRVWELWSPGDGGLWDRSRLRAHWVEGAEARDRVINGPRSEVPALVRRFLACRPDGPSCRSAPSGAYPRSR
jgi:aminoglycoside 2''-phosphotransferase